MKEPWGAHFLADLFPVLFFPAFFFPAFFDFLATLFGAAFYGAAWAAAPESAATAALGALFLIAFDFEAFLAPVLLCDLVALFAGFALAIINVKIRLLHGLGSGLLLRRYQHKPESTPIIILSNRNLRNPEAGHPRLKLRKL